MKFKVLDQEKLGSWVPWLVILEVNKALFTGREKILQKAQNTPIIFFESELLL